MTLIASRGAAISVALLLTACAAQPYGPTVAVYPSPNKPPDVFLEDEAACRDYARAQVDGRVSGIDRNTVASAVVGTVLGAGLGAAFGRGEGAAIGAASGAVVGTAIGSSNAAVGQRGVQRDYDGAYLQCMYSKGDQVPGAQPIVYSPPPPQGMRAPEAPSPAGAAYSPPPVRADPQALGDSAGLRRDLVRNVQIELKRLGMLDVADGVLGAKTEAAISTFERVKGLPVDGLPSPALLEALKAT